MRGPWAPHAIFYRGYKFEVPPSELINLYFGTSLLRALVSLLHKRARHRSRKQSRKLVYDRRANGRMSGFPFRPPTACTVIIIINLHSHCTHRPTSNRAVSQADETMGKVNTKRLNSPYRSLTMPMMFCSQNGKTS